MSGFEVLRPRPALVLLALYERGEPSSVLRRALRFAEGFGGRLHVLRVISDGMGSPTILPELSLASAGRRVRHTRTAHRRTCHWLAQELGRDAPLADVRVRSGNWVEQVSEQARALGASLIVVPPCEWRLGTLATSLARAAARPVLVARDQVGTGRIFAATDLHDARFRVLSRATQLGYMLNARVTTFHNVDPLAALNGDTVVAPRAMLPGRSGEGLQQVRRRASEPLTNVAEPLIRAEIDPVHAIVEAATIQRTDIVVVGTRYCSWWGRAPRSSVASGVVNRASQSVLVTPIGEGKELRESAVLTAGAA